MLYYPKLSPYFLKLGPFVFRWYGLAYIVGIVLGIIAIRPLLRHHFSLNLSHLLDMMSYILFGVLVGGRLGYVIFYDFSYYAHHFFEIFSIWNGGMSFHGGALGCGVAIYWFSRQNRLCVWALLDAVSAGAPLGLFLGRLANFVNGELWGRVTSVQWGMVFPMGGGFLRHPSQLYEAFFEGILLFCILYPLARWGKCAPGVILGLFLTLYGIFRFGMEFFREPDAQIGFVLGFLTRGQLLCLVMVIIGVGVIFFRYRKGSL